MVPDLKAIYDHLLGQYHALSKAKYFSTSRLLYCCTCMLIVSELKSRLLKLFVSSSLLNSCSKNAPLRELSECSLNGKTDFILIFT